MGYGQALSLPHSFSQQIKAGRQKKKKKKWGAHKWGARTPSTGLPCPPFLLPVSLISSVCFQGQLLQPCRPPTTSLSAALDSSKSSSVSTPWHCQCPPPLPPPLPCHTERPVEPKPSSLASPATCSQSYTLSNSSASLLSLCFVAHIVVPVCHHMANGYPQQKERGEREEVRVWEKKVKVHPQQGPQLRDQQKHHSCSRTRRAVFQRVTQRQSSDWMQCE